MKILYCLLLSISIIFVSTNTSAFELALKHELLIKHETYAPTVIYTPNGEFLLLNVGDKQACLISVQGDIKDLQFQGYVNSDRLISGQDSIYFFAGNTLTTLSNQGEISLLEQVKFPTSYGLHVNPSEQYILSGSYEISNLLQLTKPTLWLDIEAFGPSLEFEIGDEILTFRRDVASWFFDTSMLKAWSLANANLINKTEVNGDITSHKILNEEKSIITYTVGNTLRFWDYKNNKILKQKIEYNDSIYLEKFYDQTWLFSEGKMYNISWQDNKAHAVLVNDKGVKLTSKANFSADGKYALLDESPNAEKKLVLYEIKENKFTKLFDINEPTTSYSLNPTKRELAIYNDKKLKIYSF
ncbi:hypothetical protein KO527_17910 [Pseudoalteromonas sp. C2R02]|uniref:hypothetical protein n=1 Tax=Pseudoalteromonas sp. C2R02 TaxID=2841565 RepID=UPI001C08E26D|nr:hypothetical protein [Pseudoalteromonas sp. C2R02]MBU2971223.1 hypothetical protein [Pseudoalteromonas sp. C2R02]